MRPGETITILIVETPRGMVFVYRDNEETEARELLKEYPGAKLYSCLLHPLRPVERTDVTAPNP